MAIFATFQILLILRVLTVFLFFFFIEQLNVIICFLSLLLTAFYFQFCSQDTGKKRTKKITVSYKRMADFVFSESAHEKISVYFVSTCIGTYGMEARIT